MAPYRQPNNQPQTVASLSASLSLSRTEYLKALGGKGALKPAGSSTEGAGGVAGKQMGNRPGSPPCIQGPWQPADQATIQLGALPGQGPCQQPGALPVEQTVNQPEKQRADLPTDSLPASLPKANRASHDSLSLSLSLSASLYLVLFPLFEPIWIIRAGCKAGVTYAWSP